MSDISSVVGKSILGEDAARVHLRRAGLTFATPDQINQLESSPVLYVMEDYVRGYRLSEYNLIRMQPIHFEPLEEGYGTLYVRGRIDFYNILANMEPIKTTDVELKRFRVKLWNLFNADDRLFYLK